MHCKHKANKMKFIRYYILACLLSVVVFHKAAAQPVSYQKQDKFTAQVTDTLYIYFKVGKTDIVPSFMGNTATLNTFDRFLEDYRSNRFNYYLQGITLQGSASPEGKARWNRILANRRADAIAHYIKNKHSVNQQFIQKDNITINPGAHYSQWPQLRSTRVIVDYKRISKEEPIPQVNQPQGARIESVVKCPQIVPLEEEIYQQANAAIVAKNQKWGTDTRTEKESSRYKERQFRAAFKTNALYDILLTPNIGVEVPVYKDWSVALNWMYAWWKRDNSHWYHRIYGGDFEIRRWFKQLPWSGSGSRIGNRSNSGSGNGTGSLTGNGSSSATGSGKAAGNSPLTGWHIGAYGQMLTYDFEWGGRGQMATRWSYAAGIAAGYSMNIAKNLNLDFTLGVGYLTGEYHEYEPMDNCYVWQATKHRHWIGPTKAEVSLVWLLGRW